MSLFIKRKTLKKAISTVTAITTVVWLSGISMLALTPAMVSAAVIDGSLIKSNATNSDGTPTYESLDVYIVKTVGTKKFKRLVLNPTVFESYGHLNYGDIQTVSETVMDEYTTSGLVRVDTDPDEKVYALTPDGDIGSKGWVNLSAEDFLGVAGSEDGDSIYTINSTDGGNYTAVGDVTTVTELATYYATGELPEGAIGGDLTAALASDTPASGTIVAGQATADLTHILFTNGSSSDSKVTGLTLKRIGVSGDITLQNIYLFDGATRLTDAASVSSGNINFSDSNGLFTVSANSTKNIAVKSDILTGTSGQTVGVELEASNNIISNAATIGGTFPISGNVMSIATASLAGADFTGTTLPTTNASLNPADDVLVWQKSLTISNRDVDLARIAFREIGSVNYSDINNFRLYVDGTLVGDAVAELDSTGYITFAPATPYTLTTGSRVVKVMADVVGGSSRTFTFSLRNVADIDLVDSSYGVNLRPTVATATFTAITCGVQTISSGSITVQKSSNSPSGNVVLNNSDAILAEYTMTAYGESVKVETLTAGFTYTDGGTVVNAASTLRNGRLLIDGVQVGSTTTLAPAGTAYTTNFTIEPGAPVVLEIRADIYDNDSTSALDAGDTIVPTLILGTNNGQGKTSSTLVGVPTANQSGNTLTVASGSMSLSKYSAYANQTVVIPQTAYKLGDFVLTGDSSEDINVNTIQVDFTPGDQWTVARLTDVYLEYDGNTTSIKPTVNASGNTWSISYTLLENSTIHVEVYGNVSTFTVAAADDTMVSSVLVSGTTASSAQTVSTNSGAVLAGQTMTAGVGTIVSAVDPSTPAALITVGNTTKDAADFKFTTTNDYYDLTEVVVTVSSDAASTIQNVILKDGSTTLKTVPLNGLSATFSGLSVRVDANDYKSLTVALELGSIGSSAGTSGANDQVVLDSFKANNSQGVETSNGTNRTANVIYVYKSIPTIVNVSLPSSILAGGTNTLSKFSVVADGIVGWKKIVFTTRGTIGGLTVGSDDTAAAVDGIYGINVGVAVADTKSIDNVKLYDYDTNTEITGTTTYLDSSALYTVSFVATTEQEISGTKTYVLKGNVLVAPATSDSVQTNITQTGIHENPTAYANVVLTDKASTNGFGYIGAGATVANADTRETVADKYTTATVTAAATVVGIVPNVTTPIQEAYGLSDTTVITLAEGTTENSVGAATFTVSSGDTGLTCTPYTGTSGTGAVTVNTTLFSAVQSVVCTGVGKSLKMYSFALTNDSDAVVSSGTLTITLTKAADYAIASTVATVDSDFALALVASTATFIWTDQSAASHTESTSDWNNDYLVKNLPTDSQVLTK